MESSGKFAVFTPNNRRATEMRRFATSLLLVVALTVTATVAYPASYEKESNSDASDDAEYIVVPLSHHRPTYYNRYPSSFEGFDGVVDTGDFAPVPARPVYFPSYNPFSWHLSGYLDDLLKRVRDRFSGSWNPFYGGDYLPSGPGFFPVEIPDDSSEDGVTNTTSTVKVIDGHKVVINDTYYTKKTEFGTSIFKVRVIDVKPTDDGSAEATTPKHRPMLRWAIVTVTMVRSRTRNRLHLRPMRPSAIPSWNRAMKTRRRWTMTI